VRLEPRSEDNEAEFKELDASWLAAPVMGGVTFAARTTFAPPMLVREQRTGNALGIVANQRLPGDVAAFVVFVDPARGRAGYGAEATALYISHLFDSGARLVTMDVLSFNPVNRQLQRFGLVPQARMREHVYAAGRYWDVVVYSFSAAEFVRALAPHRHLMPGGTRHPVALGSSRKPG